MENDINLFPIAQIAKWHNMAIQNYVEKLDDYIKNDSSEFNREKVRNYKDQILRIIEFRK